MSWFEVSYNKNTGTWQIYKVTANGQNYVLFKVCKTEQAAKNFARKHWVKRWT